MKNILLAIVSLFIFLGSHAQEMRCKAIVNAGQIQGVDKKVFKTLEQAIENFINSRKWTTDTYEPSEKIDVVFSLVLSQKIEGVEGGYGGSLSIQASRPIFNSNYSSSTVNYVDKAVSIKYIQFQALDFNDNRVTGSDALASNLTALLAYYTYMVIGLDYDSFSLKGGTTYFNKALNVVNNSPENRYISGWKASESKRRNRYWLVDQILNNRFSKFRTSFYTYHRKGLDNMIADPAKARKNMNKIFYDLKRINQENPSSVLLQFFFNAKSDEFMNFIKNAARNEKELIIPICSSIDVRNAQRYFKLMR